jgi:hypothetical protein
MDDALEYISPVKALLHRIAPGRTRQQQHTAGALRAAAGAER